MTEDTLLQKQHYERIANEYAVSRNQSPAYTLFMLRWSEALLSPWLKSTDETTRRSQSVLDPMCGHGNFAKQLIEYSDNIILNDLSPSMLSHIDSKTRSLCKILEPGDVSRLPLQDCSVDVVVISGGLHHVYNQLETVLNEIYRILKPGGLFLFGEPSNQFLPVRLMRNLIYKLSSSFQSETERAFTYRELKSGFAKTKFQKLEIRPFGSFGYLLMGQLGVIPLLKHSENRGLFSLLEKMDTMVENNNLLNQTCFALVGSARKKQEK